jgi:GNAT superfamily N-acetyltransferase
MIIRNMNENDALAVATLHTETWREAYGGIIDQDFLDAIDIQKRADEWTRGITLPLPIVRLVAEESGELIGFASGLENRKPGLLPESDCELWELYVSHKHYRGGAGNKLFEQFKKEMLKQGKKRMSVWVLEVNHRARAFYEKNGFILSHATDYVEVGQQRLFHLCYELML